MKSDLIPTSDNDLVNLLQNLGTRLAPLAATLGLTAADATAVTTDATGLRNLVLDQEDKYNAAKSATAAKLGGRTTIEKRTRSLIRRIKAHSAYTPAMGEQLGIAGSAAGPVRPLAATSGASADDRPSLRASVSGNGAVMVKFAKQGHTGVLLYSRRGDEREFVLLAKQLRSPLIDRRENGAAGQPEMREYMAQYFEADEAIGQMSDTTSVTIPAARIVAESPMTTVLAKAA